MSRNHHTRPSRFVGKEKWETEKEKSIQRIRADHIASACRITSAVNSSQRLRINEFNLKINCPFLPLNTHTHTYIHIYTHTHTHIYIYIYIPIYTHTHTHIYIYTHLHTRTHTHTHTRMHACRNILLGNKQGQCISVKLLLISLTFADVLSSGLTILVMCWLHTTTYFLCV